MPSWGMVNPTLTAVVVAHNEAARLPACLETLRFADAIIVLLDKTTDNSAVIAAAVGATVLTGSYEREGDRRNTALAAVTTDWILEVDADERVSPELANEIRAAIRHPATAGFKLRVDNFIGDRLVKHGWGGSFGKHTSLCLFRRGTKHWGNQRLHPKVTFTGMLGGILDNPLQHYVDDSLSDTIARLNRYTTARAQDIREHQDGGTLAGAIRRLFSRFWKCYVGRQGYREGVYGLVIALAAGLYPLLSYCKAHSDDKLK